MRLWSFVLDFGSHFSFFFFLNTCLKKYAPVSNKDRLTGAVSIRAGIPSNAGWHFGSPCKPLVLLAGAGSTVDHWPAMVWLCDLCPGRHAGAAYPGRPGDKSSRQRGWTSFTLKCTCRSTCLSFGDSLTDWCRRIKVGYLAMNTERIFFFSQRFICKCQKWLNHFIYNLCLMLNVYKGCFLISYKVFYCMHGLITFHFTRFTRYRGGQLMNRWHFEKLSHSKSTYNLHCYINMYHGIHASNPQHQRIQFLLKLLCSVSEQIWDKHIVHSVYKYPETGSVRLTHSQLVGPRLDQWLVLIVC